MTRAYLQHGQWGGPYLTESVPVRETDTPWSGRTATGYGRRLPTPYQVRVSGRWRRVKAVCYGNASTLYIGASPDSGVVVSLESGA